MNKQILKLAQQAGMYVDVNGNPWPKWMSAEECEVVYTKFAELIVRECMRLNSKELSITAIERLLPLYREHFGVEE